jgi:hypothetical protein
VDGERIHPVTDSKDNGVTDTEALVKKYVSSWHEPDADSRRKAIAGIWSENGVYSNAGADFHGHEGVFDAVTEAYEAFVKNGYEFQVAKVDTNHDAVRYQWVMAAAGDNEPASIGTHVATLGADGRIVRDYQFIDKAPS